MEFAVRKKANKWILEAGSLDDLLQTIVFMDEDDECAWTIDLVS